MYKILSFVIAFCFSLTVSAGDTSENKCVSLLELSAGKYLKIQLPVGTKYAPVPPLGGAETILISAVDADWTHDIGLRVKHESNGILVGAYQLKVGTAGKPDMNADVMRQMRGDSFQSIQFSTDSNGGSSQTLKFSNQEFDAQVGMTLVSASDLPEGKLAGCCSCGGLVCCPSPGACIRCGHCGFCCDP